MAEATEAASEAASNVVQVAVLADANVSVDGGKHFFWPECNHVTAETLFITVVSMYGIYKAREQIQSAIAGALYSWLGGERKDKAISKARKGAPLEEQQRCTDEGLMEDCLDYESGAMKERLQEEFSKSGTDVEGLEIDFQNLKEVNETRTRIENRTSTASAIEHVAQGYDESRFENEVRKNLLRIFKYRDLGDIGATQDEMKATQDEMRAARDEMKATRDEMKATRDEMKATRDEMKAIQDEMKAIPDEMKATRNEMKATQDEMKATQDEMKATQDEMKATQDEMKASQDEVKSAQDEIKTAQNETRHELDEKNVNIAGMKREPDQINKKVNTIEEKGKLALLYVQKSYDEDRFETPVSKDMMCGICKGVLNNPKGCCNGHFFCSNCITRFLLTTTSCPQCPVTLTPETLQDPPHDLTHSLSELHIHCDYQERGCNVVVLLKDLQSHVDECEFAPKDLAEMFEKPKVSEHGDGKDTNTPSRATQREVITKKKHGIIILGGCLPTGHAINSVEMYVFTERMWIELQSMTIPRSKLSLVLVDDVIVVSGGDVGTEATDRIEIMKMNETAPRWTMLGGTLPVPLSGHCTVVYQGKLIVIGGYDGHTGRLSNKIFEISLTPIYSSRNLGALPQAISGNGAELVDGKIFIFGGGSLAGIPNKQVWMYDLATNVCSPMPPLPYPVLGMATVRWGKKVILLGGIGALEQELDNVIAYDTETGETRNVSRMRQRRGGCSAVLTSDKLVALGNLHNNNTVECSRVTLKAWDELTNTRDAREFCAAVISSINLQSTCKVEAQRVEEAP